MSDTIRITVKLTSGDVLKYDVDRGDQADHNQGTRLQKMMESQYLYFDLGDGVSIIPMTNVLSIDVTPKPLVMPQFAITNARRAD